MQALERIHIQPMQVERNGYVHVQGDGWEPLFKCGIRHCHHLQRCAIDITGLIAISQGPMKLNRKTGRYTQTLTLKNSDGPVTGPISLYSTI